MEIAIEEFINRMWRELTSPLPALFVGDEETTVRIGNQVQIAMEQLLSPRDHDAMAVALSSSKP